jgi:hypothetical protein
MKKEQALHLLDVYLKEDIEVEVAYSSEDGVCRHSSLEGLREECGEIYEFDGQRIED